MSAVGGWARRLVERQLSRLATGRLLIEDGGVERAFGEDLAGPARRFGAARLVPLEARLRVHDPGFYRALVLGGHIGAAEAYAEGLWDSDDLPTLIRLLLRNRPVLEGMESGLARLAQPARWLGHLLRRNTRSGSRRNIAAHYDLGNEFFAQFLDGSLTYSSAYFERPGMTLAQAQTAKYERLCAKLELRPDHHLLEIGTGWGGFALHAASRYGCRVTTTTISERQHRYAVERVAAAGLADRVTVLRRDYRDLEGRFDRVASIEMVEAVGHRYFGTFFARIAGLLEPDGVAAIQAITIQDRLYDAARRDVDFIKRYIFPGSCIPAVSVLLEASRRTDLRLLQAEDFGPHYARTLREWRERFDANRAAIESLGFDRWFQRLWRFYFAYCEGGFAEGTLGVSQLKLARPLRVDPVPEPIGALAEVA
ncbi:MAG: cyclopropane-fatty-acyl-phospholipid synthase family protein [Gemmatimonadales bacterium]